MFIHVFRNNKHNTHTPLNVSILLPFQVHRVKQKIHLIIVCGLCSYMTYHEKKYETDAKIERKTIRKENHKNHKNKTVRMVRKRTNLIRKKKEQIKV